jgi:hypothetical protein
MDGSGSHPVRRLGRVVAVLLALALPLATGGAADAASGWRVVHDPHDGSLLAVDAISATDVWSVGYYYDFDAAAWSPLSEHWNGTIWSAVEPPRVGTSYNALQDVSGTASNDVWAVGYSSEKYYPNYPHPLAEHWNGSSWTVVKTPPVGIGELRSVVPISPNDVWAVGQKYASPTALIEHWDGTAWTVVSGDPGAIGGIFNGIDARSSTDVWAVGSYSHDGGTGTLIERWDGNRWTLVPSPNDQTYSSLNSIALDASSPVAWTVGVTNPGAQPMPLSERYDGSTWSLMPTPYLGNANNILYGVTITPAGVPWSSGYAFDGNSIGLTMRWTGSKWKVVDDPAPSGSVLWAITSVGSTLWAVGDNVILRGSF